MKQESWKVFFACALGAGIGSLVALEMNQWFWWVGLLVGSISGYLSYEWRSVLHAIPQAYRAAKGYRTPPYFWRLLATQSACIFFLVFYLCLAFIIPQSLIGGLDSFLTMMLVLGTVSVGVAAFAAVPSLEGSDNARKVVCENFQTMTFLLCPPVLVFYVIPRALFWSGGWLVKALLQMIKVVPKTITFICRFFWKLFLLIHSEMRVLCGVDAMLGAAIGFFAGSAIVGALAGGILGVVNYVVITERWLKPRGYITVRVEN